MMITVTCVAPERRLLALLPHDRVGLLEQFLRELPASVRAKIRAVCIDLKEGWRRAVERALPGVPIVADPFHVIQDANRRVDEARRVEQELTGQRIPRWPLVKNEEDLAERQAAQLAAIRQRHKNVAPLPLGQRAIARRLPRIQSRGGGRDPGSVDPEYPGGE